MHCGVKDLFAEVDVKIRAQDLRFPLKSSSTHHGLLNLIIRGVLIEGLYDGKLFGPGK